MAYLLRTIMNANKNTDGLRAMKDRGFSQEGMLEKVIEVTAIQAQQIKNLALVALLYTQSDSFDSSVAMMMVKMGRGEEALQAMMDAKLRGK